MPNSNTVLNPNSASPVGTNGLPSGSFAMGTNSIGLGPSSTCISGSSYNPSWAISTNTTSTSKGVVEIQTDLMIEGDLVIGGLSLKDHMQKVNERLMILQPKPELLEKYETLKEAYDRFRFIEALIADDMSEVK